MAQGMDLNNKGKKMLRNSPYSNRHKKPNVLDEDENEFVSPEGENNNNQGMDEIPPSPIPDENLLSEEAIEPLNNDNNDTINSTNDGKEVIPIPEGGSFKESPNSISNGIKSLSDLRNKAKSKVTKEISDGDSYLPKVKKVNADDIRSRYFSTKDDLQKRAIESSAPMQRIADQNRENIAPAQDEAREAMRKALLAKAGSRVLSTLGMASDKMGTTPFGRPDNSNIYKNIEQTGEDIMQGAHEKDKSARRTFDDYLTSQQAANQFAMNPIQQDSAIEKEAQNAMRGQFDMDTLETDIRGKELDNSLKEAKYSNLMNPKSAEKFSPWDRFNMGNKNKVIYEAGKAGNKMAKDLAQYKTTVGLVPKKEDGTPDFDKMDQGKASLFGTNVAKMINGGQMSDLDVNTALGIVGWKKTIPALISPFATPEEKQMAKSEAARIMSGQTVNKQQLKNLYAFIESKGRALDGALEDIIQQYKVTGAETTDIPEEYYDQTLRRMFRGDMGSDSGGRMKQEADNNLSDYDVVDLDNL